MSEKFYSLEKCIDTLIKWSQIKQPKGSVISHHGEGLRSRDFYIECVTGGKAPPKCLLFIFYVHTKYDNRRMINSLTKSQLKRIKISLRKYLKKYGDYNIIDEWGGVGYGGVSIVTNLKMHESLWDALDMF